MPHGDFSRRMMHMLQIEMLPAERGDSILISYGEGDTATNFVLIDGGPVNSGNYDGIRERLSQLPQAADGRRYLDLLVVSHVDTDHIEGAIRLLQDTELRCVLGDIWFNGWRHLEDVAQASTVAALGGKQGEFLGALLQRQGRPWNQLLRGGPVVVPSQGDLPEIMLKGGLKLTLLSPTVEKLQALANEWEKVVKQAGFQPGDAEAAYAQFADEWWARPPVLGDEPGIESAKDNSEANGSSIAFLAEFGDHSALLAADAHDDVLTAGVRRLREARGVDGRLPIDAVKLSHHGSDHNTTPQLMKELEVPHYLVSSSGARFKHPDATTIDTVIRHHAPAEPPVVLFNYLQPQSLLWKDDDRVVSRYEADSVLRLD
jgi:hypothetical protein